ncbi:MAG: pilus assembly protein TadG-related protein [Candidatus Binatia bacterium]
MNIINNERGTVLVFITLSIVLLLVMVGMGLDTGHLVYVRAQGQAAVDAAALAAASAIPTGSTTQASDRAAAFNSKNNYADSSNNLITAANLTYVQYSPTDGTINTAGVTIANANGVRVALETTNPHTGTNAATAMISRVFLMPLLNLFGHNVDDTAELSVSAVAVIKAAPGLPIAIEEAMCSQPNPQKLLQSSSKSDNSGYTTYWIHNASATEIRGLLKSASTCGGGMPSVGVGFPTQLNNGQISSVYSDFGDVFQAHPGQCFLIPVVQNGSKWNQTEKIIDFAKFCPDAQNPVVKNGSDKYLYGSITCGQNPYNTTDVSCYVPTLVRDVKSGM